MTALIIQMMTLAVHDLGATLAQQGSALRHLRLARCQLLGGAVAKKQVHVLEEASLLELILLSCPALQELHLDWMAGFTRGDLEAGSSGARSDAVHTAIARQTPLRSLSLVGCAWLDVPMLTRLARTFPSVQSLDISWARGVDASLVLCCLRAFKHLRALDLCHCAGLSHPERAALLARTEVGAAAGVGLEHALRTASPLTLVLL
jgi:hypothetical protein